MSDATLTTALISITCVLVVISSSVLTFIASSVGQCYLRRKPAAVTKNSESSKSGPATEQVEDFCCMWERLMCCHANTMHYHDNPWHATSCVPQKALDRCIPDLSLLKGGVWDQDYSYSSENWPYCDVCSFLSIILVPIRKFFYEAADIISTAFNSLKCIAYNWPTISRYLKL